MKLVDTHCHIHDAQYSWPEDVLNNAREQGVDKVITVGTSAVDSRNAINYAIANEGVYAMIGIHPGTEVDSIDSEMNRLVEIMNTFDRKKIVGMGDIGLDYHYKPYDRAKQIRLLEEQLSFALEYNLPVSFHVREAFEDFWRIFDSFVKLRGTLHCYTDGLENLQKALDRELYISINGIETFNTDSELNKVFAQLPTERLLFETDAPFLAPKPYRGKTNQPAYIFDICKSFAKKRNLGIETVAKISSQNVADLFDITID